MLVKHVLEALNFLDEDEEIELFDTMEVFEARNILAEQEDNYDVVEENDSVSIYYAPNVRTYYAFFENSDYALTMEL